MEWIDAETQYPTCERIECLNKETGERFVAKLCESKWGNFYWYVNGRREWTHWREIDGKEPI